MGKVKIEFGQIKFEVEGDDELIERERQEFFKILPQAIVAVSPVVEKQQVIQMVNSPDIIDVDELPDEFESLPKKDTSKSLASFLKEKGFQTDVDKDLGVAYYLTVNQQMQTFTTKDIEDALKHARIRTSSNTTANMTKLIRKGYIEDSKETKEKCNYYYIMQDGIDYCIGYKPTVTNKKQQTKKTTKKQPATLESNLSKYSLKDLHVSNYCNLTKIDGFNKQIYILMYMLTRETDQEYFSYNDLLYILKNIFKINTTPRKLRYFFDQESELDFDKKIGKPVHYKIMDSGEKKALQYIDETKKEA